MRTKIEIHLKMEAFYTSHSGGGGNAQPKFPNFASPNKEDTMVVGLRSLVQGSSSSEVGRKCNIVFKSSLKTHRLPASAAKFESCYLKSCHLCNKKFSPDKDIYMYRGDIGFCSVECRSRQIEMDELKELLESSTTRILQSHGHCSISARCQTRPLIPSNASDLGLLIWD